MTLDAHRRSYLGLARGVIMAADDTKLMQTIDARGFQGEYFNKIERPQLYGHHSVPMPPDENGGKAAEVVIGFINGNRSHPIVIAEGDRRYGAKNWQPGDAGLWHYSGCTAKFTDNGWQHDQGPKKRPYTITVGNAVVTIADGKITCQVGGSSGPAIVVKADAVYAGGDPDQGGNFYPVQTTGGVSNLLKAKTG